jgi:hypothetical protein
MRKIYLEYSKPLDDTDLDSKQTNSIPCLAGRSRSTDNGTCKERQRKGDRTAYRQASHRLVKLLLGLS